MHLGHLIGKLQSEQCAELALAALGDAVFFTEVATMAARYDETPAAYVALAASRFANLASNDDWVAVIGAAKRSMDPARAMLAHMLRWSLQRDARDWMTDPSAEMQTEKVDGMR